MRKGGLVIILMVLGVLGLVFLFLVWMAVCMLLCAACGLILRLCVGPLAKDAALAAQFPGFAGRAAKLGIASIVVGLVSAFLFVLLIFLSDIFMDFGLICVWVCTLLCVVCGVQLLLLAKKLRWAVGAGAPYGKRRVASKVLGILSLIASLPGVVLSVYFIAVMVTQ